jgi:hypothetical protein
MWVPSADRAPVREFVFTPQELCRVMGLYGELVAQEMRPTSFSRFRVRARGLFTGLPLAAAEWVWSADAGQYRQDGELWVTWPPRSVWPPELVALVDQHTREGSERRCGACTLSE